MTFSASSAPRPKLHGLGGWLAFAFCAISVLLSLVLSIVGERTSSGQLRADIGARLSALARQTTNRLDRGMYERYREVELMARRMGSIDHLPQARSELDAIRASYRHYAWIGLTDPQGRVLAASGGLLTGVDVSRRPWFTNALRGTHLGDVHEAVLLANALRHQGNEPLRFVDVAFPVFGPAGEVRGVLGAHLSWDWAKDTRRAVFEPTNPRDQIELLIVSSQGTVLLGPSDLEGRALTVPSQRAAARGEGGHTVETWPDGRSYLVGYARSQGYEASPGLDWTVLVRQPLAQAYQPVAQLQARLLGSGLAIAAVFSLIGWAVARQITRPLLKLAGEARRLERGEPVQLSAGARYRELDTLSAALGSMVHKLQELNAGLERRVEERTAELSHALERVRANEKRVQVILESAQDPFVAVDLQGCIIEWNSRAESLFGWQREEVLGRPLARTLLPARYVESLERAFKRYAETGRYALPGRTLERILVDRDGREIHAEVRIGLVDTGTDRFFSAFLHDISARKEVERLKSEFISTVSHELRTPMTAIYGSLGMLQSGMAGELPVDAQELVNICTQSSERLIRLINEVLDVEKIASGQLKLQRTLCALPTVVMQAIRDTQPFAAGLGVAIDLEQAQDAVVCADADRLMQVIVNLLSNAAKFSPRGGRVAAAVQVHGDIARVSVVDNGPGIPIEFRGRIFDRFAQADASDRRQKGGTGLGLNICRSIVEAHQGRIDFTSEPQVRTEFFFELPLHHDPEARA